MTATPEKLARETAKKIWEYLEQQKWGQSNLPVDDSEFTKIILDAMRPLVEEIARLRTDNEHLRSKLTPGKSLLESIWDGWSDPLNQTETKP